MYDLTQQKYFKGYYDDGFLLGTDWVSQATKCTQFRSSEAALNRLNSIKEDNPELVLCVVKITYTTEVTFNF